MQIRKRIKTAQPENAFETSLEQELLSYTYELSELLNAGLKFSDNFNAQIITITDTGAANSENTLAHTLKRVPEGFIITYANKAVAGYDSGTSWTTSNIYLKFNAANCNVKVLVF